MIGLLQFVLATMVVLNHLWLPTANKVGAHAVIAFYVISGFLMTKVIREVYGVGFKSATRFLTNRVLRIYPPYLIFLSLSLLLLHCFPNFASYSTISLPATKAELFRNVTLIDLTRSSTIVIPPAWSLGVEMFFYFAMAAGLSRSKGRVIAWLVVGVAITFLLLHNRASFGSRYYPVYAASLFFSIGASIYYFDNVFSSLVMPRVVAFLLLPVYCIFPLMVDAAGFDRGTIGYYGSVFIFVPLLVTFLHTFDWRWRKLDRDLGDLAYPVFITHFFAAGLVKILFPVGVTPSSFLYFALSFGMSVGISLSFVLLCRLSLDLLRDRIRERGATLPGMETESRSMASMTIAPRLEAASDR